MPRKSKSKQDTQPSLPTIIRSTNQSNSSIDTNTNEVIIDGLGERISKVTKALGIPECPACTKRRGWLNNLFTFKRAQMMTNEEYLKYEEFYLQKKTRLTHEDMEWLNELYNKSFSTKGKLCRSCRTVWNNVLSDLNKLYLGHKENMFKDK